MFETITFVYPVLSKVVVAAATPSDCLAESSQIKGLAYTFGSSTDLPRLGLLTARSLVLRCLGLRLGLYQALLKASDIAMQVPASAQDPEMDPKSTSSPAVVISYSPTLR